MSEALLKLWFTSISATRSVLRLFWFVGVALAVGSCAPQGRGAAVTPDRARELAAQTLRIGSDPQARQGNVSSALAEVRQENPSFYVVEFAPEGWALVAKDDSVSPSVLAFSPRGHYAAKAQPEAVQWLLGQYVAQIDAASARVGSSNVSSRRPVTLQGVPPEQDIAPLLPTSWNQDWPYNAQCPEDATGPGGHAWAGCVATAMGQIMRYWSHPVAGQGSHSYAHPEYGTLSADFGATRYAWSEMPPSITASNGPIAQLLFHIGVATEAEYSGDYGTPIWANRVATAFRANFDYSIQIERAIRSSFTEEAWHRLLLTELGAGHPIFYIGVGGQRGSHSFVCDGYRAPNYFHVNWGWGGQYDGYYTIDALTPGSDDFTGSQEAIIGLRPAYLDTGFITKDTMWSGRMVIEQQTTVADGVTLTIMPGAVIEFAGRHKLDVMGTIQAVGTEAAPIVFTARDRDVGWGGVRLNNGKGYGGCGGIMSDNDPSELRWCIFRYGNATSQGVDYDQSGGAVFVRSFAKLSIADCRFEGNRAPNQGFGGAVRCMEGANIEITRCAFTDNEALHGGAIEVTQAKPTISHCVFQGNRSIRDGAALHTQESAADVGYNRFEGNQAGQEGGAAYLDQTIFHHNTVVTNRAKSWGGGISARRAVLEHNDIRYNTGNGGAGVFAYLSPRITDNKILENFDAGTSEASGLAVTGGGTRIIGNLICGNRSRYGPAILAWDTSVYLANNTIADNQGALAFRGSGSHVFVNNILHRNVPNQIDIQVPSNWWTTGQKPLATVLHSLVDGGRSAFVSEPPQTVLWLDANVNADPGFIDRAAGNYRLRQGSPCINSGTNGLQVALPAVDVEGSARVFAGTVDMGAIEASYIVVDPVAGTSGGGGVITIRGAGFGTARGQGAVLFGDVPAADYVSWSDDTIVCRLPAHREGPIDVRVVTNSGEEFLLAQGFAFQPQVAFEKGELVVDEGAGVLEVPVVLSEKSVSEVTVHAEFSGTAQGNMVDYSVTSPAVTIPAGQTNGIISIRLMDDTVHELDESIILSLVGPVGADLGRQSSLTILIRDNDPLPSVSWTVATQSIGEGASGRLSVQLSGSSSLPVRIPYTVGGSALGSGVDHDLVPGVLEIPAGSLSASVNVSVFADYLPDPDDTVVVMLGQPENAVVAGNPEHWITILDSGSSLVPALSVKVRGPGTTVPPPGTIAIKPPSTVTLEAVPDSKAEFTHWALIGLGECANPAAALTSVALYGSAEVTACFQPQPIIVDPASGSSPIADSLSQAVSNAVIILKDGVYRENLVITRPVTLRSQSGPQAVTIVAADTSQPVIKVTCSEATVEGLSLYGGLAGVSLSGAHNCVVRSNRCGLDVTRQNVDGIYLEHSRSNLVEGNECRFNRRAGIQLDQDDQQDLFLRNICETNVSYGIFSSNARGNTFAYNVLKGNSGSTFSSGLMLAGGASNTLFFNFFQNQQDVDISNAPDNQWSSPDALYFYYHGEAKRSRAGNFYSGFSTTDADGDGIGDESHPLPDGVSSDPFPLVGPAEAYTLLPVPSANFVEISRVVTEAEQDIVLQVTLTETNWFDVRIPFKTCGSTANGSDFAVSEATVLIPAHSQIGEITIRIHDDASIEKTETIYVTLGMPDNALRGLRHTCVVRIEDNEPPPNTAPRLLPIEAQFVAEGEPLRLQIKAEDKETPQGELTFALGLNAPDGATIDPKTGWFSWLPSENQGPGAYSITVQATDTGSPPLSVTRLFSVTVAEANTPPVLVNLTDQTVDEGMELILALSATDGDWPANKLTYSLAADAPPRLTLDPVTGVLHWTPTEDQGPSTNRIGIRVSDDGSPPLTDERTLTITVREVNAAPELVAIDHRTVRTGDPVTFTVIASDPADRPPNTIKLSAAGLPDHARFDPLTGEFSWTPSAEQVGDFLLTFTATDDGQPPLWDNGAVTITVEAPDKEVVLAGVACSNGEFRFRFATQRGRRYQIQSKARLSDLEWQDRSDEIAGTDQEASFSGPIEGQSEGYYRVIVLGP